MRGKYGAAAAVRQEVTSRDSEIATYQRRVVKLTAELRDLRALLRDERIGHQRRVRELEARLREAADPKITALETQLAFAKEEASRLDGLCRRLGEQQDTASRLLVELLVEKIDVVTAAERVVRLLPTFNIRGGKRFFTAKGTDRSFRARVAILTGLVNRGMQLSLLGAVLDGDAKAIKRAAALHGVRLVDGASDPVAS